MYVCVCARARGARRPLWLMDVKHKALADQDQLPGTSPGWCASQLPHLYQEQIWCIAGGRRRLAGAPWGAFLSSLKAHGSMHGRGFSLGVSSPDEASSCRDAVASWIQNQDSRWDGMRRMEIGEGEIR